MNRLVATVIFTLIGGRFFASLLAHRRAHLSFPVANCPGTSGRTLRRFSGVVRPLTKRASNWMNGRHVQNIESHRGNLRKLLLHVAKACKLSGAPRRRSRKELVPRGKPRSFTINPDGQFRL